MAGRRAYKDKAYSKDSRKELTTGQVLFVIFWLLVFWPVGVGLYIYYRHRK